MKQPKRKFLRQKRSGIRPFGPSKYALKVILRGEPIPPESDQAEIDALSVRILREEAEKP